MKYTDTQLLSQVKQLSSFKRIPSEYWLIGVRNNSDNPDKFDDKFYLYKGEQFIKVTTGTTNPGLSILQGGFKDYNKVGAAVVKADEWYYDLWTPGKHQKKIDALVQLGNKIKYYRDGNLNDKSEQIGTLEEGYIGINFHSATYKLLNLIRVKIGAWSAGCQVCNNDSDYSFIIKTIHQSGQKRISYCLLNQF